MDEESGRKGRDDPLRLHWPTPAMSQSIIRTNYPVVGKAALDCHSGTMSGHFRDVFCIRGIGSKGFSRHGRERNAEYGAPPPPPPPLFETCLLEGELDIYIYIHTYRRGKAKEQDEDEGRKRRVAMTRDERKRNGDGGRGASGAVTKTKKEEEELLFG